MKNTSFYFLPLIPLLIMRVFVRVRARVRVSSQRGGANGSCLEVMCARAATRVCLACARACRMRRTSGDPQRTGHEVFDGFVS